MGAKKFDTSLETREVKLLERDIPGFCRDIPEVPEKFEKKKFVFNFRSLCKPTPFHPLNFGGGVSEAPCFTVLSGAQTP